MIINKTNNNIAVATVQAVPKIVKQKILGSVSGNGKADYIEVEKVWLDGNIIIQ